MLEIYNTLTKKKQAFKPIKDKTVGIYTCGPTVYDHAHIGNIRSYIFADLLSRVLTIIEGYKVEWVVNITDIDDKIIDNIKSQKGSPESNRKKLTEKYFRIFTDDIKKVGIDVDKIKFVFATDNIELMRRAIKKLVKNHIAYISDGSVYFNVKEYQTLGNKYGVLANLPNDAKSRITDDQDQKKGVADFALWKGKKDNEPFWDFSIDSHNLPGRPGWHIECSVMSTNELGRPFDIHTGGVDLVFPHHENEIAQSGGELANYFVHNEHLLVEGHKMSKSLNNFITLEKIDDPIAFRFLCLLVNYQSKMDFSFEALDSAKKRLAHLRQYCAKLLYNQQGYIDDLAKKVELEFKKALENNLNSSEAIAALSILQNENSLSSQSLEIFKIAEDVFGLDLIPKFIPFNKLEKKLISSRSDARRNMKYNEADNLRDKLKKLGIECEDLEDRSLYWRF